MAADPTNDFRVMYNWSLPAREKDDCYSLFSHSQSLSLCLCLSLSLCHCLSLSLSSSSFLVCVPDLDTFCRNCWTIMYSPSLVFFRWVQVCFFFVSSWFFSPTVIRFYLASLLPGKQTERTQKTQSTARWVICSDTLSHWNWRLKTGQQPHVFSLTQGHYRERY